MKGEVGGHPDWCAGPPLCTAAQDDLAAQHRSQPRRFTAPAVTIEISLHRCAVPRAPDTFLTLVVSDSRAGTHRAGCTMSTLDAWNAVDLITGLLEQVG
ncbi:MAG TPA: hypothetical protein VGP31_05495 [Planosporangium sp.]|nr:hypothetical protein [Planosporangium sp.]